MEGAQLLLRDVPHGGVTLVVRVRQPVGHLVAARGGWAGVGERQLVSGWDA